LYLVEIHGKLSRENENKEDILTSNVFSFLKYAQRSIFLYQFIRCLGLGITKQDAEKAEFRFWPSLADKTEPDVVITIGKYYLLFEAKYKSGFREATLTHKHQLERECEQGAFEAKSLGLEYFVVIVTSDASFPIGLWEKIRENYKPLVKWVNWQKITYIIYSILNSGVSLTPENKLLADDLYKLLVKKHLRNYEGTKSFRPLERLGTIPKVIFFEAKTAIYRGEFLGFLSVLGGTQIQQYEMRRELFYTRRRQFWHLPIDSYSKQHTDIFFSKKKVHDAENSTNQSNQKCI
jgi:hypothetical protein